MPVTSPPSCRTRVVVDAADEDSRAAPWLTTDPDDISNGPLLLEHARLHRPILLGVGGASDMQIRDALGVIAFGYVAAPDAAPHPRAFRDASRSAAGRAALADKVTLLHAAGELGVIAARARAFELPLGISDVATGALAAAALGACVVVATATAELAVVTAAVRAVEAALAAKPMPASTKALATRAPIAVGESFTTANLGAARPGRGVSPMALWSYLGKPAARAYHSGEGVDAL